MHQRDSNPDFISAIKALGANWYNLILPETKALPSVIQPDEQILGLVYGRYKKESDNSISRGVLVATNKRALLLNKKFMFKESDEIRYGVISGVNYSRVLFIYAVTVHTRMGDVSIRTFNQRCAKIFVSAIENQIFKHQA